MPVMSRLERFFCCSILWGTTGAVSPSALPVDKLGGDASRLGLAVAVQPITY
jgi:hypothetical protein